MTKVSIKELTSDPANVRKHSEKNIKAIEASLKRFGQQKPIVIDQNNIVRAGNGTLQAAINLGWDKIWVNKSNLNPSELTAYAIADNRTAELAEWDLEPLSMQLESLDTELAEIAFEGFVYDKNPEYEEFNSSESNSKEDNQKIKEAEGSREILEEDFQNFQHQCPRCRFEFNDN